ncbi:MAG TPA: OsmC family protein [Blastocatellia bacterium]|nr:OsmC family protein [Blastocatellia bacterium]
MNDVRVTLAVADGFRSQITAGAHMLVADEPILAGGTDEGLSPYELLLAGLGACTAMTLRMYIERKRLPVTDIEVRLSFDRIHAEDCLSCSEEEKAGKTAIQRIRRLIHVTGDVTEEQRARLLYIAGRCPVHVTLQEHPHVEDTIIVRNESRLPES